MQLIIFLLINYNCIINDVYLFYTTVIHFHPILIFIRYYYVIP